MNADKSQRKIELLQILAEGCRKHPAYRARRAATQRCQECVVVWNARLELNDMSAQKRRLCKVYFIIMNQKYEGFNT